jgi:hypothetical protein
LSKVPKKLKAAPVVDQDVKKKDSIVASYADLFEKLHRSPTMGELGDEYHYSKDSIKHHFGSLSKLEQLARTAFPSKFFDVEIEDVLGALATAKLHKTVTTHKTFIITTAVTGCAVHEGFHKSIKTFCGKTRHPYSF